MFLAVFKAKTAACNAEIKSIDMRISKETVDKVIRVLKVARMGERRREQS